METLCGGKKNLGVSQFLLQTVEVSCQCEGDDGEEEDGRKENTNDDNFPSDEFIFCFCECGFDATADADICLLSNSHGRRT